MLLGGSILFCQGAFLAWRGQGNTGFIFLEC